MCGIIGAVSAGRDVSPFLVEGLTRLEYRGYDSAGLAVVDGAQGLSRMRATGKVAVLRDHLSRDGGMNGRLGIAHTRWATHGEPTESNAHPHVCRQRVAVVHNGIIENYRDLRARQLQQGYEFTSETDTEVIVHQIHSYLDRGCDLLEAVTATVADLEGAYALGVIAGNEPNRLVAARRGSPLVIGLGETEQFVASDSTALLAFTDRFVYLEEGDVADISQGDLRIYGPDGRLVERTAKKSGLTAESVNRGGYRHYMLKEIHEQPDAIAATLEGRLAEGRVLDQAFGPRASELLDQVDQVRIVGCGTSYHAGLVARNWFEGLAGVPCRVEVASEFRYREFLPDRRTLVVAISQSGETADTLAAIHSAQGRGFGPTLSIVNAPESSLVRDSDLTLLTRAGPEIGVASTKAFTTQLVALLLLVLALGRRHGLSRERHAAIAEQLAALPGECRRVLALDSVLRDLARQFADKHHALFLGRGVQYPVAMEGALKLKEISYIHAEAYPAGELKHGPLALVDARMPVVAVAPNDGLLGKLKSNLEEVRARGGRLFVITERRADLESDEQMHVFEVPGAGEHVVPIVYTLPLQLLAYHAAVIKGTDVDKPRNLAKSVTVE